MIDPEVRPATAVDAGDLEALEAEARAAVADARGGPRWLEEHPSIGSDWPAAIETRRVFVAVLRTDSTGDGVVVGYLVLDVGGAVAHVDQVYVTPEARELGFGDALLAVAADAARAAGCTVLEGHALPGDRETKNLYERAGITARLITVSTRL
jgi:GNAT superfamily N-acetyltransferase